MRAVRLIFLVIVFECQKKIKSNFPCHYRGYVTWPDSKTCIRYYSHNFKRSCRVLSAQGYAWRYNMGLLWGTDTRGVRCGNRQQSSESLGRPWHRTWPLQPQHENTNTWGLYSSIWCWRIFPLQPRRTVYRRTQPLYVSVRSSSSKEYFSFHPKCSAF